MNDELERLRREVETLTAERDHLQRELEDEGARHWNLLNRVMEKTGWDLLVEADLKTILEHSTTSISDIIAQLECDRRLGPDERAA